VKQESSPPKRESKSQHRLSKTTHELLSEIFKKIGSKDQTNEVCKYVHEWLMLFYKCNFFMQIAFSIVAVHQYLVLSVKRIKITMKIQSW